MKLRTIALRSKLRLTALTTKLRVVVGEFISAVILLETVSILEALTRTFGKTKQDVVNITDHVDKVPRKNVSDLVAITDGGNAPYFAEDYVTGAPNAQTYTLVGGFYWTLSKVRQDAMSVFDDATGKYLGKNLSDNVTVAERISGVSPLDESVNETPAITDSRVNSFSKPISDTTGIVDSKVFNFSKRISDTPRVGDVRTNRFSKPVSDAASITDSVNYRNVSKVVSEVSTVSSSGSLRSQGYTVDMSYFAEDYVGSSRAFS